MFIWGRLIVEVLFSWENMFWSLLINGIMVFFRNGKVFDVGDGESNLDGDLGIEFVGFIVVGCVVLDELFFLRIIRFFWRVGWMVCYRLVLNVGLILYFCILKDMVKYVILDRVVINFYSL